MSQQTLQLIEAFEEVEQWYYDLLYRTLKEKSIELLPALVLKLHYGTVLVCYGDSVLFDTENNVCILEDEEGNESYFDVSDYAIAIKHELKRRMFLLPTVYKSLLDNKDSQ